MTFFDRKQNHRFGIDCTLRSSPFPPALQKIHHFCDPPAFALTGYRGINRIWRDSNGKETTTFELQGVGEGGLTATKALRISRFINSSIYANLCDLVRHELGRLNFGLSFSVLSIKIQLNRIETRMAEELRGATALFTALRNNHQEHIKTIINTNNRASGLTNVSDEVILASQVFFSCGASVNHPSVGELFFNLMAPSMWINSCDERCDWTLYCDWTSSKQIIAMLNLMLLLPWTLASRSDVLKLLDEIISPWKTQAEAEWNSIQKKARKIAEKYPAGLQNQSMRVVGNMFLYGKKSHRPEGH